MTGSVRAIVLGSVVGALMVLAAVQDRVTAAGARQYITLQSAALSGNGAPVVTIDAVMAPVIRDSVRRGLLWGGVVLGVGLAGAAAVSKRARRE